MFTIDTFNLGSPLGEKSGLLAPDIIEAIVDARTPCRLTLEFLLRRSIPREWEEQRRLVEVAAVEIPEGL